MVLTNNKRFTKIANCKWVNEDISMVEIEDNSTIDIHHL